MITSLFASGILSGLSLLGWHFVRESFFRVAFCPAVYFWSGILSGVVFVCGILSADPITPGMLMSYLGGRWTDDLWRNLRIGLC